MVTSDVVDVLIIGAGISGIGAAYHLQTRRPDTRYAMVETRADLGGTWDVFRYPGVRSDSDLHTFGYDFKPWVSDQAIAGGPAIKAYLAEAASENGIGRHIRFRHKVLAADWSSSDRHWVARVQRIDLGDEVVLRASWLFTAAGYFRHEQGHTPTFPGIERFRGKVVHPQHWPDDLDYAGKRVVVIGSGATAVTLVPAMAASAGHVTLLQRTPSYVVPMPSTDPVATRLRPWLGVRRTHAIARRLNIARQRWAYSLCRRYPVQARRLIRRLNVRMLGADYPVDVHFNPPYAPWDQRLCAVPGGDLFKAIRQGTASMVTDRIATFSETGIQLVSGATLEADIVVTATGLHLQPMGGIRFSIDGSALGLQDTVAFKGTMLSGVPNLAFAIGYTNASWTLKVGLLCEHFCRLLDHMDAHGFDVCTPVADPAMVTRPLLDFGAGYVQRSLDELPRQGAAPPWLTSSDYTADAKMFRETDVADPQLRFTRCRCC